MKNFLTLLRVKTNAGDPNKDGIFESLHFFSILEHRCAIVMIYIMFVNEVHVELSDSTPTTFSKKRETFHRMMALCVSVKTFALFERFIYVHIS